MLETWEVFQQGVRDLLPVDDERCGVQTFIDKLIRAAIIDLMHHVPCVRINMETLYTEDHIQQDGTASVGKMPICGEPFEARFIFDECVQTTVDCCQTGDCNLPKRTVRYGGCSKATPRKVKWAARHAAACMCASGCRPIATSAFLALSPDGQNFYSFPPLKHGRVELMILWQKGAPDWADDEQTTLSEMEHLAVSAFVKSHLALQMGEKQEADAQMVIFKNERMRIFKNCKRRKDLGDWQNHD